MCITNILCKTVNVDWKLICCVSGVASLLAFCELVLLWLLVLSCLFLCRFKILIMITSLNTHLACARCIHPERAGRSVSVACFYLMIMLYIARYRARKLKCTLARRSEPSDSARLGERCEGRLLLICLREKSILQKSVLTAYIPEQVKLISIMP